MAGTPGVRIIGEDDPPRAVLWALAYAFLVAIMYALPKLAGTSVPVLEITFFRYMAGFVIVAPIFVQLDMERRRERTAVESGHAEPPPARLSVWFHAVRAFLAIGRISLAIGAVQLMPLANAQAILLTNGVFVFIFASLFLKEPIGLRAVIPAIVCLAGGIITAQPDFSDAAGWLSPGAALAFASSFVFGLEAVVTRFVAQRERPRVVLAWINLWGLIILAPVMLLIWVPVDFETSLILISLGPVALAVQYCVQRAYGLARASFIVPFRYMTVIFSIGLGLLWFGEQPTWIALIGMALIALGGSALAWFSRPVRERPRIPRSLN